MNKFSNETADHAAEAQERLQENAENLFFVLDNLVSALRQDAPVREAFATELIQAERVLLRAMGADMEAR